jgi:hypothetical protein
MVRSFAFRIFIDALVLVSIFADHSDENIYEAIDQTMMMSDPLWRRILTGTNADCVAMMNIRP